MAPNNIEGMAFKFEDQIVRATISSGVAIYPDTSVTTVEELIARADAALYSAKSSGRNLVRAC